MGLFGTLSRIAFCALLLWSAYQTYENRTLHAKELVEKYGKFQQFVQNQTGIELPHKSHITQHKDLVLTVFLGSEALTAVAILFGIPYIGIFYAPYLLTTLLLEDNFLLAKGAERTRLTEDFLVDLAILGAVLMFAFPPKRPSGKKVAGGAATTQKPTHTEKERSASPKGGKAKKAKRE